MDRILWNLTEIGIENPETREDQIVGIEGNRLFFKDVVYVAADAPPQKATFRVMTVGVAKDD